MSYQWDKDQAEFHIRHTQVRGLSYTPTHTWRKRKPCLLQFEGTYKIMLNHISYCLFILLQLFSFPCLSKMVDAERELRAVLEVIYAFIDCGCFESILFILLWSTMQCHSSVSVVVKLVHSGCSLMQRKFKDSKA